MPARAAVRVLQILARRFFPPRWSLSSVTKVFDHALELCCFKVNVEAGPDKEKGGVTSTPAFFDLLVFADQAAATSERKVSTSDFSWSVFSFSSPEAARTMSAEEDV